MVFVGQVTQTPRAADDAKAILLYDIERQPPDLLFDHNTILQEYLQEFYPIIRPLLV